MNTDSDSKLNKPYRKLYLHYALFIVLLATTFFLWRYFYLSEKNYRKDKFIDETQHIIAELEEGLVLYKVLLNAAVGIFTASDEVNRSEWRLFHKFQQTKAEFPDFQSLCYIPVIKKEQASAHLKGIWAQGFNKYEIIPEGTREIYAPVTFIEPLDSVNIIHLGNDYFANPVRRVAMERARDTGGAALSGEVGIFNGQSVMPGFMMVAPVFRKGVLPINQEERQREIAGFIAVNIETGKFTEAVFRKKPHILNVMLYDIDSADTSIAPDLMYSYLPGAGNMTHIPLFRSEKIIDIYNHSWKIIIESTPEFESGIFKANQLIVIILGVIISFLTLFLLNTLTRTADKAKKLAMVLTSSLKESEEKLRQITDNMSDAVFTTDKQLITNYISPSIKKLTGFSVEEYLKLTMEQRHPASSVEKIYKAFREEMENEQNPLIDKSRTRVLELEHYKVDGSVITTLMHISFLRDDQGNLNGVQGITHDITERKKAERELYEKTAYLENLVNYANAPIVVWNSSNIITRVNAAFEQLTGRSAQEVVGSKIDFLFPETTLKKSINLINQTKKGNRWETVEIEILCKDGTIKTLLWNSANIYDQSDNTLNATIAQGFDITEVKHANAALVIAKERAEQSDRLKTAFINNISHEIRTPLNGILGFGQLLSDSRLEQDERESYYELLKNSSDRLIQAVTDNLDIAQISSGTLTVNNICVNIRPLYDELFEYATGMARSNSNLEVFGSFPQSAHNFSVFTDRELLKKAIIHLISNAIKFTEQGTITLGFSIAQHSVEFYISDTGRGINPEMIEEIFKPYYQEATNMNRGFEGSGLGLAIVKGIAELLGGDVVVESHMGAGSTFYFSIPKIEAPEKSDFSHLRAIDISSGDKPLILIAEDDESSYLYQQVVLRRAGYNTIRAQNGAKAVELCETIPEISLVLMDIKMPVMDGIEATGIIKGLRKNLPVIAVTAYAQSDDEHRILKAGCDDYVTKPIKSETLLEKISRFISKLN